MTETPFAKAEQLVRGDNSLKIARRLLEVMITCRIKLAAEMVSYIQTKDISAGTATKLVEKMAKYSALGDAPFGPALSELESNVLPFLEKLSMAPAGKSVPTLGTTEKERQKSAVMRCRENQRKSLDGLVLSKKHGMEVKIGLPLVFFGDSETVSQSLRWALKAVNTSSKSEITIKILEFHCGRSEHSARFLDGKLDVYRVYPPSWEATVTGRGALAKWVTTWEKDVGHKFDLLLVDDICRSADNIRFRTSPDYLERAFKFGHGLAKFSRGHGSLVIAGAVHNPKLKSTPGFRQKLADVTEFLRLSEEDGSVVAEDSLGKRMEICKCL